MLARADFVRLFSAELRGLGSGGSELWSHIGRGRRELYDVGL